MTINRKMTIDKETRDKAIKQGYVSVFCRDIECLRFFNIQKLYEAAHITNDDLIEQLHRHALPEIELSKTVFNEIAYLLADAIPTNNELTELFDVLYYPQYKKLYDNIQKIIDVLKKDHTRGCEMYAQFESRFDPLLLPQEYRGVDSDYTRSIIGDNINQYQSLLSEFLFFVLLQKRSEPLIEAGVVDPRYIIDMAGEWDKRSACSPDFYRNDDTRCFTTEDERVLSSDKFYQYVKKQKEALANYLEVPMQDLADYFYKQLQIDFSNDEEFLVAPNEAGVANLAAIEVINSNYGQGQWILSVIASKKNIKDGYGYRPDFEKLAVAYYTARVKMRYAALVGSGQPFSKVTLARHCKADSPRDDYLALLYLYNVDIVFHMFRIMQEQYFRNFSWEKITNQSAVNRANIITRDLGKVIESKNARIADLERRISAINQTNEDTDDDWKLAEIRERNKLLDTIEDKEKEIVRLKDQIESQKEYIELLKKDEVDEEGQIDLDALQYRRYLFVGHTEDAYPELYRALKRRFPDSIFMRSETDSIDQIKVDAVVFFIKWASHGMYYKVRANNALRQLPTVYCNTKNADRLLQEMYERLERSRK